MPMVRLLLATAITFLSSFGYAHAQCDIPKWVFQIAGEESTGAMTVNSGESCDLVITWTAGKTVVHAVTLASAPAHGTAQMIPNSGVTYRSQPGYRGSDSFTIQISGHGASCDCEGSARVAFSVTVK
jgi:hypothetical protein